MDRKEKKDTEKKTVKWRKIVQYLNATSRQKNINYKIDKKRRLKSARG